MKSRLAEAIGLTTQPVAVYRTATPPANALRFREGVWGCVIALLYQASKGRTAAFDLSTTACPGARPDWG